MNEIQKEFEIWAESENMCRRVLHNIGWTTYMDANTESNWKAWKDSRSRLTVKLPDWSEYDTPRQAIDAMKERLDSLGVKWSEL